jgi:hypothetical protein
MEQRSCYDHPLADPRQHLLLAVGPQSLSHCDAILAANSPGPRADLHPVAANSYPATAARRYARAAARHRSSYS